MKVIFCTPIVKRPHPEFVDSLKKSLPRIEEAGWEHGLVQIVNNPYISCARADMLHAALKGEPDAVVFLDYDLSWKPKDMLKLLEAEGDVVAGTYRYKKDEEEYMGWLHFEGESRRPVTRDDGCIKAAAIPAGFLKVTPDAIRHFMKKYPELVFGDPLSPHVDLFNHGARNGAWWGEDYAFSDRWIKARGEIWIVPDIDVNHHAMDDSGSCYEGNFHKYLMRITS